MGHLVQCHQHVVLCIPTMTSQSSNSSHRNNSHHHGNSMQGSDSQFGNHTLTPMLDDSVVVFVVDEFLAGALQHPKLRPFYLRIDRLILRQKLSAFICELFGGKHYDRERMAKAHRILKLRDDHFDAVMEVLDKVFDMERDGIRLVSWKMKVAALRDAEELREEIIHPEQCIGQPADKDFKDDLHMLKVRHDTHLSHVNTISVKSATISRGQSSSDRGLPIPDSEITSIAGDIGLSNARQWNSEQEIETLKPVKKKINRCVQS